MWSGIASIELAAGESSGRSGAYIRMPGMSSRPNADESPRSSSGTPEALSTGWMYGIRCLRAGIGFELVEAFGSSCREEAPGLAHSKWGNNKFNPGSEARRPGVVVLSSCS